MSKRPSSSFNDPGYFYSQRKLLKIFAISSLVLGFNLLADGLREVSLRD